MNKRILTLLMCLVLCFSLVGPAFADISIGTDGNGNVDIVKPGTPDTPKPPTNPGGWYPSTPSTPSDPTYDVTAPAGSVGGAINLNKTTAKKGDTVTVTATPEPGYMLVGGVTVKDANGKVVKTNRTGKGVYTFAMPGSKVTVDAVFKPIFTDITAGDYYDAILWAAETALTTGDNADGTTFGPGKECMRRDIVTFLWRAAGQPDVAVTNRFTDVPANAYYAKAVAWAVANNITNGVGDGTRFDPDAPCTRAQVVTFLHRSHKEPLPGGVSTFTDVGESYYTTAVSWAVENGITKGVNAAGTLFAPDSTCTRAQIVTFLYRDMEK